MESSLKADNLSFGTLETLCFPWLVVLEWPTVFANFTGNLECTFTCFSTRIWEEDLKPASLLGGSRRLMTRCKTKSTSTLGSLYKKRCELRRPLVVIQIACMDDFGGLFIYNLQALRYQSMPLDNIHTFKRCLHWYPNIFCLWYSKYMILSHAK